MGRCFCGGSTVPGSGRHGIPRRGPCLDAPLEGFDVREALRLVLRCLTGSRRLSGSGAIEDDLLVSGQGRQRRLKARQRHRAFELHLVALLLVFVAAHEERTSRRCPLASFLNADARDLWHSLLLSHLVSGSTWLGRYTASPTTVLARQLARPTSRERFDGQPSFLPASNGSPGSGWRKSTPGNCPDSAPGTSTTRALVSFLSEVNVSGALQCWREPLAERAQVAPVARPASAATP